MELRENVQIIESSRGVAKVRIIAPGFNSDKSRYYDAAGLAKSVEAFDGVKVYCNHPSKSEMRDRPERDVRQAVGVLENVRTGAGGALEGVITFTQGWFKDLLEGWRSAGLIHKLGVSLIGGGKGVRKSIQGIKTTLIEQIAHVASVDIVTDAGAGGMILAYEAARDGGADNAQIQRTAENRFADIYSTDPNRARAVAKEYLDPGSAHRAAVDARIQARRDVK